MEINSSLNNAHPAKEAKHPGQRVGAFLQAVPLAVVALPVQLAAGTICALAKIVVHSINPFAKPKEGSSFYSRSIEILDDVKMSFNPAKRTANAALSCLGIKTPMIMTTRGFVKQMIIGGDSLQTQFKKEEAKYKELMEKASAFTSISLPICPDEEENETLTTNGIDPSDERSLSSRDSLNTKTTQENFLSVEEDTTSTQGEYDSRNSTVSSTSTESNSTSNSDDDFSQHDSDMTTYFDDPTDEVHYPRLDQNDVAALKEFNSLISSFQNQYTDICKQKSSRKKVADLQSLNTEIRNAISSFENKNHIR